MLKLLLILIFYPTLTYSSEITADSSIVAVTVFPDRADISRQASVVLPAGKSTLVFNMLPAALLTDSLRVDGSGSSGFMIGSVETKHIFSDSLVVADEKKIQDKITNLRDHKLFLENEIKAINTGKTFIEGLSKEPSLPTPLALNGTQKEKMSPETWQKAWQTIQTGMLTLGKEALEKQFQIRKIDDEITALQNTLRSIATGRKSFKQVRVNVEASTPVQARLILKYQMFKASWTPLYEARLNSTTQTVEIMQFGNISQKTGEDWKNVALTLSTASPFVNMTPPTLTPQWLEFASPMPEPRMYKKERMKTLSAGAAGVTNFANAELMMDSVASEEMMQEASQVSATTKATEFSGVFEIKGVANVPADGAEYRFGVDRYSMPAVIRAETFPSIDPSAYLIATVTFQGQAPLLAGTVALFRDGAFIGNSAFSFLRPNEKLHLSFGQDDKIRVTYTPLGGEKSEGGIINRDTKVEFLRRTEVQNLHAQPIKIAVYESLPISKDTNIAVKIITDKTSVGYVLDPNNKIGVVMWETEFLPKEKKTVNFGYTITYPKDKILQGL